MPENDSERSHSQHIPGATPAYADDLYCPECGYSLRGLTSKRCPECGLLLDFIESGTPMIPWERRRDLDWLRAYWQTVLMVIFRSRKFCRAFYQPVSYSDAQAFRWVSILHVYVPALFTLGVVHYLHPDLLPRAADETGWWFVVFVCLCALLALIVLTGLPSYFFHPKYLSVERQNRAVALSYYGCAPLALAAIVLLGMCVGGVLLRSASPIATVWLPGALLLKLILAICWTRWGVIGSRTLRRLGRRLLVYCVMPLLVVGVGFFGILIGLPLAAYFIALALYSLRGGPGG